MELTNEERKRNLSKLRQRKFYEQNKVSLLDKRKKQRSARKQPENIPQVEARESKSLDYLNTKIDSVCDNDMTKLTHKQRMKIFFQLTEINDIEQDLMDYDKIINCMETATYGKS